MAGTVRPFIMYGDSPSLPTGLARIGRDLMARIVANSEELGLCPAHVGVSDGAGLDWLAWPCYRFMPSFDDQGELMVQRAITDLQRITGNTTDKPIVMTIMDPGRCYALLQAFGDSVEFWCYVPIDGATRLGDFGGPAREALQRATRVIAYGRYGAEVLRKTLGPDPRIHYLPHGIEPGVWSTPSEPDAFWLDWYKAQHGNTAIVGVVATNQVRKDFGVTFKAIRLLEERLQRQVALWVHTDKFTKVWDLGELCRTNGLARMQVCVTVSDAQELDDRELAGRYQRSHVTLAPGLGEGFGYPIVESLAAGTPCVHVDYAGGTELIPVHSWRIRPQAYRAESVYAIERPVLNALDVADKLMVAIGDQRLPGTERTCLEMAARYSWETLWPKWDKWIKEGLKRG